MKQRWGLDKSVEELWTSFKSSVNEGLSTFVSCKQIGSKKSLSWITQEIKRFIRKKKKKKKKKKKNRVTKNTNGHQDQKTGNTLSPNDKW